MVQAVDSRQTAPIIIAGFVLAATAVVLVNVNVPAGESGGTTEMIGTLIFLLILAAALYFLLPRVERTATPGIVMGVVAILTLAVYWSGAPILLGAGAIALGRRASSEGTRPMVAQALGAIAVVGVIVAAIADKAT